MPTETEYDVIGDIHGQYMELHQILTKMGYVYDRAAHNFSHPTRKALFVGDFVDGGSENVKVVTLVRNMVEADHAEAIMGNHEFNAVQYATPSPHKPGEFLRKHDEKNIAQHAKFLAEVADHPALYASIIDWFKTLPVYLKKDDLHVVHACWDSAALESLKRSGAIMGDGKVAPQGWHSGSDKNSSNYRDFEILLKGPEEAIGHGYSFIDAHGAKRSQGRIRWWVENPATYAEAYTLPPSAVFAELPFISSASDSLSGRIRDDLKHVGRLFFGHYWMSGDEPAILSPRTACVDYSVARKGGKMLAYRTQAGETTLSNDNLVWVPRLNNG